MQPDGATALKSLLAYLYLCPPVHLGASGDEKSPSVMATGDPASSMPANTHLIQVFFESTSPCLLWPPPLSSVVFWHQCIVCAGLSLSSRRMWPAIFLLLVLKMSWSPCLPSSPPLHLWHGRVMRCRELYSNNACPSSSVVFFTHFSPTCGRILLPALPLWSGRQPYMPRVVGVAIYRLGVVEIAPSPHHCFRTAHPCTQSVKSSSPDPAGKDSPTSSPILTEAGTSVFPEPQSAAARRRVEGRDCAHEALPRLQSARLAAGW